MSFSNCCVENGGIILEVKKLRSRTYYIPGVTNLGLYRFKSGYCLLVDTPIDNTSARHVLKTLDEEKLKIKHIINTHAHPDHFGSNDFIKEHNLGAKVAASKFEKMFMENSQLQGMMMYGASPMMGLSSRMLKAKETVVDIELVQGTVEFGGKKFEIVPLGGHTPGQIGVVTEDDIIFCGDAFFSEEKLQKYPLPFLVDVKKQLKTLNYLLSTNFNYYIISHVDKPIKTPKELLKKNIDNINSNLELMLNYLAQPLTREDLTRLVMQKYTISTNLSQYFITLTSIGAFLTYLLEQNSINADIVDEKLYFYV